ncbi:MAG: ATP-binding protein [Saprospiraceae bacterium]
MLFADLIGQHSLQSSMRQMAQDDRIPHAQLLVGGEGSGKLALALAFAQYALCTNRTDEDSCGKCSSCVKASKLIHPDLHFSYPAVGTNVRSEQFLPQWREAMADNPYLNVNQWLQRIGAENKQGNINKEECANIIRKLSLKTFEGNYKILLMWLPEYLGKEGNRLLKLIEEPPENTLFILVAEDQEKILNTILSRCQLTRVKPLTDEAIEQALREREGMRVERAKDIVQLAGGNYNEALQLVASEVNGNSKLFLSWLRKCYVGNGVELADWTEAFAKLGRENQKYFLQYALHFMREYMVLKLTGRANVKLQPQELTTAQNLTKVIELNQIEQISQLLTDCSYHVERNANPKILFLDASIRLNHIMKK